ncbi:hypothetical protein A4S05_24955 [Nostoc sp. KVJ20]|uniref:trypsin-like serine peptidase n=1 Tax=Nostoc sp. KVJ20 TaxID=457944 RepID=UPI00083D0C7D|nr:serine protease [Nostoc sp. KVJ20]ODH02276.1 hypothetical protein A4S05_24955 [Nostoc sp. KVJ20]
MAIIQHPGGHLKKISIQNNFVAYTDNKVLQYTTSTEPGSSGSPVFDDDFQVVGIHHSGGSVCKSQVMLAKEFNEAEYPRIPLYLPPLSLFPPDILKDWLRDMKVFRDLQIPADLTYQRLWEKSDNGIPQFVYEEICTHFDLSWEGGLAKWLI